MTFRIVGGQFGGRKLQVTLSRNLRPTSHRVREALFNILQKKVCGAQVYDLFAGTGAIGIEALSHGAQHAVFIEKHIPTAANLKKTLDSLSLKQQSTVLSEDVFTWAQNVSTWPDQPVLMYLDPPYALYDKHVHRMEQLLTTLLASLPKRSSVIMEHDRHFQTSILPLPENTDLRYYGNTALTILTT